MKRNIQAFVQAVSDPESPEFVQPAARIAVFDNDGLCGMNSQSTSSLRSPWTVPMIVRLPELDFFDDREGKPAAIQKFIGRRPIAAFGNSDGDLQMLQWTAAGPGRRLMMLVDHTDAEREFDYRVSPMGRLEVALSEAQQRGWTVVSMKDDWRRIFSFE